MICIKYETIQQPKRSLSSKFELALTNWSQTRGLEFSLDKTVLYHYFEVSFLSRNYVGEFVRCIITSYRVCQNFYFQVSETQ